MHGQPPICLASLSLALLALLPQVQAHGYVAQVAIDGKVYIGNVPNAQPTPSIVRQINDVSPVKGASNPYLNCGQDAQNAALVADANPGSQLNFWWKGGDGSDVSRVLISVQIPDPSTVRSGRTTSVLSCPTWHRAEAPHATSTTPPMPSGSRSKKLVSSLVT
jgi:hypothetical protein